MIKIVDYGLGNIAAFLNVYKRLNIPAQAARNAAELDGASKIILPGVGAFDHAMELLEQSGMRAVLDTMVCVQKIPVLGICVGMQMLADSSEEGVRTGLGWVPGKVRSFRSTPASQNLPMPHMGWNDIQPSDGARLFSQGLEKDARFYFLHSFYYECANPGSTAATAHYGMDFSCSVQSDNVYGVQFHPEKSHHYGTQLLKNFAEL